MSDKIHARCTRPVNAQTAPAKLEFFNCIGCGAAACSMCAVYEAKTESEAAIAFIKMHGFSKLLKQIRDEMKDSILGDPKAYGLVDRDECPSERAQDESRD